jgi:ABC-type branched-subunit amino acid transport system permease subunit
MFGYDLNNLFETIILPWTLRILTAFAIAIVGWLLTKLIVRLAEKYLPARTLLITTHSRYLLEIIKKNFPEK